MNSNDILIANTDDLRSELMDAPDLTTLFRENTFERTPH